jgi:bacterioferritin
MECWMTRSEGQVTREYLAELLNEDLSREYQAIIAYVVYSQVLKGAEYMNFGGKCRAGSANCRPVNPGMFT